MTIHAAPATVTAATKDAGSRRPLRAESVLTVLAVLWMLLVLAAAVFPSLISPEDPSLVIATRALQPPGETLMGTDQYGRSIAGLIVHGAQSSIVIGLAATLIAVVLGGGLGLLGGYLGGVTDMIIGRLIDVLMCFPGVLLALIIATALGPTTANLILAVGVGSLPAFSRVMRGQVMSVRSRLYVEAAHSVGFSRLRILARHVLPNSIAPIVVLATVSVGTAIVVAASLSFLGLGPQSAVPDWGQLLASGQPYLSSAWWISTFPGLTITLTVISISLLGDGLRDSLDTD
ncbi:peptide/nickel transport system permease protein [Microbacterium sp. AG790]|uniref:ABC transporter permease n=1 Tax=Microbacterium sp. AG790 TaxID=2183995 RepID=UPI000EB537E7|nr:ABC transporter permease [Microbacterium sp. AG790]RKS94374.1 peptide/nickel transport system permease protein [Microbacterium sp. AG790]